MADWVPVAVMPNLYASDPLEGGEIAVTSWADARVQAIAVHWPKLGEFLSRFTDAFGTQLNPAILIARKDVFAEMRKINAIPSFRDILAVSVIPCARARTIVHKSTNHIVYSTSFWLYPWMVGDMQGHMVMNVPAISGFHVVEEFRGQSFPEVPELQLRPYDIDKVLFAALMKRWRRHYFTKRQTWEDRALFRSLNMAAQAMQTPGGSGLTFYDLIRSATFWVGAFEMLTHPRKGNAGLRTVYPLLERVSCKDKTLATKRYVAHMGPAPKPWQRRTLPCWLYGKLYQARNKYIHGNPVSRGLLQLKGSKQGLFWLAAPLYRFALTGFLKLEYKIPKHTGAKAFGHAIAKHMDYYENQRLIERALLRARNRPNAGKP